MPGAVPTWIHVEPGAVYAGTVGDGALPDSTLVKIDRDSLEHTVVVFHATEDGGEWLPGWHVADAMSSEDIASLVHVGAEARDDETSVVSWIGETTVDLVAIDQLISEFE